METVLIKAEIIFRSEIRVTLCVITLPTFLIFFNTSSFHVCTVTPFFSAAMKVDKHISSINKPSVNSTKQVKTVIFFVSVKLFLDHLTKNA